jgi:hypothetical protein
MNMKFNVAVGNIILCGVLTLIISFFFAKGTIAENYTDKIFVAPEFFLMPLIWGIASLLTCLFFAKKKLANIKKTKFVLINLALWITIPVGFVISMKLAVSI